MNYIVSMTNHTCILNVPYLFIYLFIEVTTFFNSTNMNPGKVHQWNTIETFAVGHGVFEIITQS